MQTKVNCPPGCASKIGAEVFGNSVFHEKSSVCRAALFLGYLDDLKGGEI